MQQGFAAQAGQGEADDIGHPLRRQMEHSKRGQPLEQAVPQSAIQGFLLPKGRDGRSSSSKSRDRRRRLGTGAQAVFLPAADLAGKQTDAFSDIQGADPLGAWSL